jgi:hypothetical protein
MASEVDLTRAINAIAVTLNDQKLREFDAERVQEITTGSLGGEQKLIAFGSGTSGELRDGGVDGPAVVRFTLAQGEWSAEQVPAERKSDALQEFEQERSEQTATEYQKPIRGRIAIWKKKFSGS